MRLSQTEIIPLPSFAQEVTTVREGKIAGFVFRFDRTDVTGHKMIPGTTRQNNTKKGQLMWAEPRLIEDSRSFPEDPRNIVTKHWLELEVRWGAHLKTSYGHISRRGKFSAHIAGLDKSSGAEWSYFLRWDGSDTIPPFPLMDTTNFNVDIALWLAHFSRLVYENKQTVVDHLRSATPFTDIAFFDAEGTQGFLAVNPKNENNEAVGVLVFRGTEKDSFDILTDINIFGRQIPDEEFMAHAGFVIAIRSIWGRKLAFRQSDSDPSDSSESEIYGAPGVSDALFTKLHKYKKVKLYVTGHSLGGALATLAAHHIETAIGYNRIPKDTNLELAGLYTFGSPKVANEEFNYALNHELKGKSFRLVNGVDVVARLPPSILGYRHIDEHRVFAVDEVVIQQMSDRFLQVVLIQFILLVDVLAHIARLVLHMWVPGRTLVKWLLSLIITVLFGLFVAYIFFRDSRTIVEPLPAIIILILLIVLQLRANRKPIPLAFLDHRMAEYIRKLDEYVTGENSPNLTRHGG
jgi:triacylglycerol lipase